MMHFLALGTLLGLSAGFTPGPLLVLVVSETLQHNRWAGIKIAVSPVFTDLPIILLTLFLVNEFFRSAIFLGIISIGGGCYVFYLGCKMIFVRGPGHDVQVSPRASLKKGIMVNALNPHPYLFWFGVGAPTTIKALERNIFSALAFIGSFYVLLVGSKILLAILVGKSGGFLTGKSFISILRILGLLLCLLAVLLLRDGLKLLGAI